MAQLPQPGFKKIIFIAGAGLPWPFNLTGNLISESTNYEILMVFDTKIRTTSQQIESVQFVAGAMPKQ